MKHRLYEFFPNFAKLLKENIKKDLKKSEKLKLILWYYFIELVFCIFIISMGFNPIFEKFEKNFKAIIKKKEEFIIEKNFTELLEFEKNQINQILINYQIDVKYLNTSSDSTFYDNSYKKTFLYLTNLTFSNLNEIQIKKIKIIFSNFAILSNQTNLIFNEDEGGYKKLKSFYFIVKGKNEIQYVLALLTIMMILVLLIFNIDVIMKYNIFLYAEILNQVNIINFLQISFFLMETFVFLECMPQVNNEDNIKIVFSIIKIVTVCTSFFHFSFYLLIQSNLSILFISFVILVLEEFLTNMNIGIFQIEQQILIIFLLIMFLLLTFVSKISKNYENNFNTKLKKYILKIKDLNQSFDYLNVPIIKINSEGHFICNQIYIEEINYKNENYNKKFKLFDNLSKIFEKKGYNYDIENLTKFLFSIENFDLVSTNNNIYINNENSKIELSGIGNVIKNSNDDSFEFNRSSKNQHINNNSVFILRGVNIKEDLNYLFTCYKKIIEKNLQDLTNEIILYNLISKKNCNISHHQIEKIKQICQLTLNLIKNVNADFLNKLSSLLNKYKKENSIEEKDFLKIGDIIIIKRNKNSIIPTYDINTKIINEYDLYVRFNKFNNSFEFTFKIKAETELVYHDRNNSDKIEENCFPNLLSNLIKKVCHEVRNPVINILQLVKDVKKSFLNEKSSFSKSDNILKTNCTSLNKDIREEQKNDAESIIGNGSFNSNNSFYRKKTLTKNSINFCLNPSAEFNEIEDYINNLNNLNYETNSKLSTKRNYNKLINKNNNLNFNNGIIANLGQIGNNNTNNGSKFTLLQSNMKKIKVLSSMINFTIQELEFIQEIVKSKNCKISILNNIKDRINKNISNFDLKSELNKINEHFNHLLEITDKKLIIQISLEENFPEKLHVDIDSIKHILYNLLSNAIKFSFKGKIILKASYNKALNKLSFNITDEGMGINEENLQLIGNFMYKIPNKNNEYGLGVGIFYIKLIVEAFEGNFLISSKLGEGTNIYIDLKLSENLELNKKSSIINSKKEQRNSLIIMDNDDRLKDKVLSSNTLADFKKFNFGPKNSIDNEMNLIMEKLKRTKSVKERKKAKLTEIAEMAKEDLRLTKPGEKYKIFICSTNNILKLSDHNEKIEENIRFKNKTFNSSSFNLSENISNNKNSSNLLYIQKKEYKNNNLLNSYHDNHFISQGTFSSSCESNMEYLLNKSTFTNKNSSRLKMDQNNYINNNVNFNNYSIYINKANLNINNKKIISEDEKFNLKKKTFSENSFKRNFFHFNSKNIIHNQQPFKRSKTLTCAKKSYGQKSSNRNKENSHKNTNKFSNELFFRIKKNEEDFELNNLESDFRSKTSNVYQNHDIDASFLTQKITEENFKINYNDLENQHKFFIPRKSINSILIPNQIYQDMKLNSSNIYALSDNSPTNNLKLQPGFPFKNNKLIEINNSPNNLKNSIISKNRITVLISDRNAAENTLNIQNTNYALDDRSYDDQNVIINKVQNINNIKNSKLKDSLVSKNYADPVFKNEKTYRFLIVDDEALIRRSQKNLIEKYFRKKKVNILITECSDGVECLYKLYEGILNGIKYDMIFTDETMNFIRGTTMARIVKSLIKENILYEIKIFMITSYDRSILESGDRSTNKDIDFFSTKPLNQVTLDIGFSKFFSN